MEYGKIWVGCLMDLMSLVEVANEASVQVRFISGFESLFVSKHHEHNDTAWVWYTSCQGVFNIIELVCHLPDNLMGRLASGPLAQLVRAADS